jgi:RND family efflux transporter MFP subunit
MAALMDLKNQVTRALANINWCRGTATDAEIAEADANVALAEATLASAQADVESLQNYPDPTDVAIAKAQLASAQAKLALAKEASPTEELLAPMDGTILTINGTVGESVGTNAIFTIANLNQPVLEIYLDETDLNQVGVGYPVQVVFDALPDQTFTGHVVSVDPSLVTSMNVTAVRAVVSLDPESFAKPQTLPIGLSASVEVISSQADNVLLVPVEAVREITTGKYGVFVMENGVPTLKMVQVGLEDYTYAEIISGLNEGDVVTTGVVETGQ